jgi:outer membrane lipoprotein SlyB
MRRSVFSQVRRASGRYLCATIVAIFLSGCANNGQNRYSYNEVGQATLAVFGTIVSTRTVDITGRNTGTGAAIGGAAGGIAGSQFGSGGGNAAATLAGVVIGVVAGAVAEQALADRTGLEYVVARWRSGRGS